MESLKSPANDTLTGFTIGVTAARRSEELITLLERRGATVVHAPAIRIIPLVDDDELRRVTKLLIEQPPDVVVVTTGIGFRGWFEAAHGWMSPTNDGRTGLDTHPGAWAQGARRGSTGRPLRGVESRVGSFAGRLDRLLAEGAAGLRIAVQLHGAASEWEPYADICDALTMAGAEVIKVPVYRWEPPEDNRPMDQLISMIVNAELDAVSFTSAPAAASMLQRAKALGCVSELIDALREQVASVCVGPVTAAPLRRLGVPTAHPQRYRLGALARLLTDQVPSRATCFTAGGHQISVRSATVAVDGEVRNRAPSRDGAVAAAVGQPGMGRVAAAASRRVARRRRRHPRGRDRYGPAADRARRTARGADRGQAWTGW